LEIDRMERLNIMTSTTGGVRGKSTNPALREQPDEIAQSAYECYKAGASVCHIRVHNKQGRSTGDVEVYNEVLSKIKAKCPIITQFGNGIVAVSNPDGTIRLANVEERMALTAVNPKLDVLTFNTGSFEFGWMGGVSKPKEA